ncbi:MAG TPA: NAD(P)-dependent oxidoreductase [Gemmatimonadaceae bacterium]|nr:NAD(P)-dependent oxidoreductase [Gemmatimonadaceae bacterium]
MSLADDARPAAPAHEEALDELLSRPRAETVDALRACPGDVIVLGAGGKMGPTLARMLARAAREVDERRVLAVSRWSSPAAAESLRAAGVETIAADLLDRAQVAALPDASNVIFMAGQKFGTSGAPATTWAMNVLVPAACAERYAGARIVAFSTGNVYPLVPVDGPGARETDAPAPIGEYAMSCLGRERVFEHAAARHGARVALLRLNYANDLRYGVLTDLALRLWRGEPVSLRMARVNVIWQGDANRIAIECLPHATTPPFVLNLTGTSALRVRDLATALGERLGRTPLFDGEEQPDALLSDTTTLRTHFAPPEMPLDRMLDFVADWVRAGGTLLGKPTKFEVRTGEF